MAKRVFFSFHYQDVIDFRANVVRQSWVTKTDRQEAGFFDGSLWESTKKTSDVSLKNLIDKGLDNTSVTAVLIGSETWRRRWVRYEIMKSLARGNTLIGIHINLIPCKNRLTKQHGYNPLDNLALKFSNSGSWVDPYESDGSKWVAYQDLPGWSLLQGPNLQYAGQLVALSTWFPTYCWISHNGYNNFATWIGE